MGDYLVSDCCNHRICCFESTENKRGYVWSCSSERIKAGTEREIRLALKFMFNADGTRYGGREPRHLADIGFEVMYNPVEGGYFIRDKEPRKGRSKSCTLRLGRLGSGFSSRLGPSTWGERSV